MSIIKEKLYDHISIDVASDKNLRQIHNKLNKSSIKKKSLTFPSQQGMTIGKKKKLKRERTSEREKERERKGVKETHLLEDNLSMSTQEIPKKLILQVWQFSKTECRT